VSAKLFGRAVRSAYGRGDPNVRLLFLMIAEEHGNPKQKDPDGWVRLGARTLAERIGCDLGTVPDVIDRAEDEGLKLDWPGPKSRLGYMLPPDLYPEGEHVQGRPRPRRTVGMGATDADPAPPPLTVGTVPTDLLAPRQHDPSVTPGGREGAPEQPAAADDDDQPSTAAGGRDHAPAAPTQRAATVAASGLQLVGRGATAPGHSTTTDALYSSTTVALAARPDDGPAQARASPFAEDNGRPGRRELQVISEQELETWEEAPLPVELLALDEVEPETIVRTVGLDVVLVASEIRQKGEAA